ncbi:MAG: YHS domain-containing (seleno)protein [Geminicoccales bacterium]
MTSLTIDSRPSGGIFRAIYTAVIGVGLALGTLAGSATAETEVNIADGYAVHGYDVVAYFTKGEPTEGSDEFQAEHEGATYRFASAEHRDAFTADPAKYAPQYGGYCAFGTAMGRKFDGDPNAWKVVDDKLYLNLNKDIQKRWLGDVPGFVRGAENNWPIIRSIGDASLESSPPTGLTQGAI